MVKSKLVSHLHAEVPLALLLLGFLVSPYDMKCPSYFAHFFHFPGFYVECSYGVLSDWGNC